MRGSWFNIATVLILVVSLVLRLVPPLGNNFYFTMDQGNDAIHVREILVRHRPLLLGPETSIFGLYAGPLWYYFISVGYFLTGGHPLGPLLLLILLNVLLTYIVIRKIAKETSPLIGIIVGAALQLSWWFYDASRYVFNPFPNTFLVFIGVFWLTDFFKGQENKYLWSAVPFALTIHTDIAPAIPINLFYLGLGLYLTLRKHLSFELFIAALLVFGTSLVPHFFSEINTNFSQTDALIKEFSNPRGVFAHSQLLPLSQYFVVSRGIYRQIPELGFLGFSLIVVLLVKRFSSHTLSPFVKSFTLISLGIFASSWIFFVTNVGWRDWHTTFLSPLIFTSVLLILCELPLLIGVPILALSFYSHLISFVGQYQHFLYPSGDPSLLTNELKVIDWAYSQSQNRGFSTYVYIPSTFDYHYQYLFWWYGKQKYGYLPCEFNTFPKAPKSYLPEGYRDFEKPVGSCPSKIRVLIMEADKNNMIDSQWYDGVTRGTNLMTTTTVGKIRLEGRLLRVGYSLGVTP